MWACRVAELDRHLDRVRVRVVLAGPVDLVAEITTRAADELDLEPGAEIWAAVKASEVTTYPA